ncbi:hypothetical protein [Nocardioides sp.]|uniref:hypothetical protein n=1 Tax=Nocardioides sp. TaxID=35761 RepID=UPI002ED67151
MTTTFVVRPDILLDARRVLLRHAQSLARARVDPPVTGTTTHLTRRVFERVEEGIEALVDDLRGLAAGLACVVELAAIADDGVWALLTGLRDEEPS